MFSSIRTQLILSFLLVVVLSLSGLSIMQVIAGTQSAQEEINQQLTTVSTYKGRILREWTNTLKGELGATLASENLISQIEVAMQGGPAQVRDVRNRLLPLIPPSLYFNELFVLDPSGKVVVSTARSREGTTLSGETFFETALSIPHVSAPTSLGTDETTVLYAGYPILDANGDLIGVLAGQAKSDPILRVFDDTTGMRETAQTYLLDLQGNVIVSSDPALRGQTITAVRQALLERSASMSAQVLNYTSSNGTPLTGAYLRLTDMHAVLLVEQVSQEVGRTWAATLAVNLSVTLSSVLVALIIALSTTRSIADPISDLVDISTQITRSASRAAQTLAGAKDAGAASMAPSSPAARANGPLHAEARELEERARHWRNETGTLALAFNQMTQQLSDLIAGLEERVAERTAELEQHTRFLEASADVSRATTSILDPDKLISQAVELIRDRYNLYYVGMFLNDAEHEWAILRSGTGRAGEDMLARRHRLRIEPTSMIGWCIANDQARVAQSASEDEVRVVNPELPDTRSEAAIPLHARGQVIGALTVQSSRPAAFSATGLAALQTMADQLAIAIDNAGLYTRSQQALEAERRAYARSTQAEWSEWSRAGSTISVRGDAHGMIVTGMDDQTAHVVAVEPDNLAIPIRVRGQTIGVIRAGRGSAGNSGSWSGDEVIFLETIAEQLGVALDSARLYAETRKRAEQERLVDELTGKMRATLDIQTVLETATREMRDALGLAEVEVRLGNPEKDSHRTAAHPEEKALT